MASTTQGIGLNTYDFSIDNSADFVSGMSENMEKIDREVTGKIKVNNTPSTVNFIEDSDGTISKIKSGNREILLKGQKGDKGDTGTASVAIDDSVTNFEQTWTSGKISSSLDSIMSYKKCDKGVNIEISTVSEYSTLKTLIDQSIACGVNSFAIMVSHGVSIYTDNVMDDINTTVTTILTQVLNYLKTLNLNAHLRVCIYTRDGHGNLVNPSDPNLFLDNWKNILLQYCAIINPLGFREITISNEMQYLTNGNRTKWQEVISSIKETYNQIKVGINFNIYDIKTDVVYDLFDILGFNFYPCLTKKGKTEDRVKLKRAFYYDLFNDDCLPKLLELHSLYPDKKLIVSEIGTWADKEGLYLTWKNSYPTAVYDEEPQRIYYELFFELLYEKNTTIDSMYLFTIVENSHRLSGYSFLGKQAENIVKKYWLEV